MMVRGAFLMVLVAAFPNAVAAQHAPGQQHAIGSARAKWEQGTRVASGVNAADLRRRAIKQKLLMRAARSTNAIGVGGGWSSLGPLPLPSDASGIGLQDYNWIAGRATAIAVDPNDSSGNTVYIGGANGGIWKSVNAGPLSTSPASVTWAPLTDDQQTHLPSAHSQFNRRRPIETPATAS